MPLHFLVSTPDAALIGQPELQTLAEAYGRRLGPPQAAVELSCASLDEIRYLNQQYRQLDEPTDVLSFPTFASLGEILAQPTEVPLLLGSIILCPEKAEAYGETLPQLVHHGLLHLLGFDHETDMAAWATEEGKRLAELSQAGLDLPAVEE